MHYCNLALCEHCDYFAMMDCVGSSREQRSTRCMCKLQCPGMAIMNRIADTRIELRCSEHQHRNPSLAPQLPLLLQNHGLAPNIFAVFPCIKLNYMAFSCGLDWRKKLYVQCVISVVWGSLHMDSQIPFNLHAHKSTPLKWHSCF